MSLIHITTRVHGSVTGLESCLETCRYPKGVQNWSQSSLAVAHWRAVSSSHHHQHLREQALYLAKAAQWNSGERSLHLAGAMQYSWP